MKRQGFTLLEVLLAVFMLALLMGPLLSFLTANLSALGRARADARAMLLASEQARELVEGAALGELPDLGHSDSQYQQLTNTVFALLARRFSVGESILIKPTNAANIRLEPVLLSGARFLLLYSDLPGFLVSVIKKGEAGRYFMRHLFNIFRLDRPDIDAWPERQRMLLTDLQVAALVWNIQMELFEAVLQAAGDKQVRTLNGDDFLENTVKALTGTQEFLGLGYDRDEIAQIADDPQFRRHSKFSTQDYDLSMRKAERATVEEQYSEEIATTIDWAAKLRHSDLPSRLGHSI